MISVTEALEIITNTAAPLSSVVLPADQAFSYVLVNNVLADRPLPPFNRVAMDGFAVRSSDFTGTDVELNLIGQIQTGVNSDLVVQAGEAAQIMTGAPCPEGADAVVKVENSEIVGEKVRLHEEKMKPGLNIAAKGEDTAEGAILLQKGIPLSTTGIAICVSVGLPQIEVFQKPRVKIISTGTEIIPPWQHPLPHQIRDCNSFALRSMSDGYALDTKFIGIGEDDEAVLDAMIKEGLDSEILLLSGGVSMGEFDHTPKILAANGVKNIFHFVKVKPGKPIWFGQTENGTYVFGLPGNPVSVQTCFRIFVEPLIKKLSGYHNPHHTFLKLPIAETLKSKTEREYFMPGELIPGEKTTLVKPVFIQGSGDFANFGKSQGLFIFPGEKNRLEAGEIVDFLPWRDLW